MKKENPDAARRRGLKNAESPSHNSDISSHSSAPSTNKSVFPNKIERSKPIAVGRRSKNRNKPRSTGKAQKNRARTVREMALYDGQDCLGILKVRPDGKVVAYNLAGNRVGTFASVQSAAGAFENRRVVHE
jgi:hypothetical protein